MLREGKESSQKRNLSPRNRFHTVLMTCGNISQNDTDAKTMKGQW